ncbi:MAG: AtpZ/AtpI family protein [Elusimicrobia bacterium]|nr:AtpZ/AtpI family protein [Elusimicrobiota bacterium]
MALGSGAELVVYALAGLFFGQWLDGKLGSGPYLMLLGAVAGISGGLYRLVRSTAKRNDRG